jgi:hypothetical protein
MNSIAVGLIGVVLSFLASWFWFQKTEAVKKADVLARAHGELLARVAELEIKERLASAAWLPITSAFQATLIKSLTHEHTGEVDALLVKVGESTLTGRDEERLLHLLDERTRDTDHRISEAEREDAAIFPIVMKRARREEIVLAAARDAQFRPIGVMPPARDKP